MVNIFFRASWFTWIWLICSLKFLKHTKNDSKSSNLICLNLNSFSIASINLGHHSILIISCWKVLSPVPWSHSDLPWSSPLSSICNTRHVGVGHYPATLTHVITINMHNFMFHFSIKNHKFKTFILAKDQISYFLIDQYYNAKIITNHRYTLSSNW